MHSFFQTSNASREYRAGGFAFTFDQVEVVGGSWRGVLQVDVEAQASALRTIGGPVTEVTADEYSELKKKWTRGSKPLAPLSEQSPRTLHEVAAFVAVQESERSTGIKPEETQPEEAPTITDESAVKVGTAEPPDELNVSDTIPKKRAKK